MSAATIEVRDAEVTYPGSRTPAITAITFAVGPGQAVGVVGESGSGKTTLGRVLVGAIVPTRGSALVAGRPWTDVKRSDPLRRSVQMVFQDPYASLNPYLTARETVAEVFRVWDHDGGTRAKERARDLLAQVGLSRDEMDRLPRKLSGGQCQRVGIARALACEPSVLVADEPTSSLDVSVQAQILNLLIDLRRSHQLALVLISHDLSIVRYATDNAIVMYRGRIVEAAPTAQLLDAPGHEYTRSLIASIPGRRANQTTVSEPR